VNAAGLPVAYPGDTTSKRKRGRWLLLVVLILLWLPSACTAIVSVRLYEQSIPDGRAFFVDPTVDLAPGTLQATGLVAVSLMPGDQALATLQLTNRGVTPIRISMASFPDADPTGLTDALQVVIRLQSTECTNDDGSVLFRGPLAHASFGGGAPGEPGDAVVDAARRSVLCVDIHLPLAVGDRQQGGESRVTFRFASEVAA
jgi:hypothetical protein